MIHTPRASNLALLCLAALSCSAPDDSPEPLPGALPARLVGSSGLDGASASCIALRGPLAFVGCGERGVKVVDVSRPEAPEVIATVDSAADRIAMSGDSLFVVDLPGGFGSGATLAAFDVLDPRGAELVKSVTFDADASGDLAADGRFVVLAGGGHGTLVADSRNLAFAARPAPAGKERSLAAIVRKGILFAIGGDQRSWFSSAGGVAVLETTNLDKNAALAQRPLVDLDEVPGALASRSGPTECGLCADGDRLFLAAGGELRILDVSDPRAPKPLGSTPIGDAFRVAADGPLAACATGDLAIVDVSDPSQPRALATIPTTGVVLDVAVRGRLVFAAAGDGGLRVYEVTESGRAP